ncbi:MAG: chitobiase/beta-hexosaminidase C-terminal domain-containing protein [Hoylesella shahii]|uniref:chitobiase/beta-hexosaminidase C-terminal domain-containing protein n=1 Tax=Hoylesella shahii TaxID=228603 RepID=UPI003F9ED5DA
MVYHQFTFTVPADAKAGKTRMRILCDGDGGTADFEMCSPVGYAGSMHDFGITVAKENVVVKPVFDIVDGTYKVAQMITITSATPDAKIYYTIDGQDPTATSGTLYNAPVKVSVPEGTTGKITLKAIAIKDYYCPLNIVSSIPTH